MPNEEVDLMIPPNRYNGLVEELENLGMELTILIDDMERWD